MSNKFYTLSRRHPEWVISLLLLAATVAVFGQLSTYDFVTFDDYNYVSENPYVRDGLTWKSIRWAFLADLVSDSPYADFWIPVTFLSHILTSAMFGMNPSGHHLVNLLLHVINTLLLFWLLRRMTAALWPSAFVAALFAIHPLHVESVAWIVERKDVLSTFFFLVSLGVYVRYTSKPCVNRYLLVVFSFVMALMSKPTVVTLPFLLLLLDYWPLGRFSLSDLKKSDGLRAAWILILEKVPLLILTAAFSVTTILAQQKGGAIKSIEAFTLGTRISNAFVSYISYIGKMVWPSGLTVFYPHPGDSLLMWQVAGASLLLLMISLIVLRWVQTRPYLLVGWLWYLGTLVPTIGLIQSGNQAMADRYTYVPLIGLFIMIAWGIPDLLVKWRYQRIILVASAGTLISVLMLCTWFQVGHWRNTLTLFEHTINVTSRNPVAHYGLGVAYQDTGRLNEAIQQYRIALEIDKNNPEIYNNLGMAYAQLDQFEKGIGELQTAIRINPNYASAYNNLGNIYLLQGKLNKAFENYQTTIQINPNNMEAYYNSGRIYAQFGMIEQAKWHYRKALEIDPGQKSVQKALISLP